MKEYESFVQSISEKEFQEVRQKSENYAVLWEEVEKEYKMESFNGHPEYAKEKYNRKIVLLKKELGAIRIKNTAPEQS